MSRPRALAALLTPLALLAGCSQQSTSQDAPVVETVAAPASTSPASSRPASTPLASTPAAAPLEDPAAPTVTKLLVFIVENHSLQQVRDGMPWVSRLADTYGYATRYRAITHPSLPNYLAIAGGDTFGVTDDKPPADHPLPGPSVFGRAVRTGQTATTYAEGMTSRCQLTNEGRYAVRHNPWTYFSSERRLCRRHDVPLTQLAGDITDGVLPAVGLVIPDVCNDAHDCSLGTANTWLKREVGAVLDGPDFASGDLAVVITADEDDRRHGNRVLTVVAQPDLSHVVVRRALTHYSLSRSYAEVAGVQPLGQARTARSLLRAFGLTPG